MSGSTSSAQSRTITGSDVVNALVSSGSTLPIAVLPASSGDPFALITELAARIVAVTNRLALLEALVANGGVIGGGTGGGTTTQAGLLNPDGTGALNPDGTGALAPAGS